MLFFMLLLFYHTMLHSFIATFLSRCWLLSLMNILCAAPQVSDPFQTLADIYEAKGDTDKRMQVWLL